MLQNSRKLNSKTRFEISKCGVGVLCLVLQLLLVFTYHFVTFWVARGDIIPHDWLGMGFKDVILLIQPKNFSVKLPLTRIHVINLCTVKIQIHYGRDCVTFHKSDLLQVRSPKLFLHPDRNVLIDRDDLVEQEAARGSPSNRVALKSIFFISRRCALSCLVT